MSEPSNIQRLIHAYNRMMERVKARMEELEKTEQETLPRLRQGIEYAVEKAVELGELTREEAHLVGDYVRRDLEDAGYYMAQSGEDLRTWLRFDLELIEDRLLELFSSAADKTRLEILNLEETTERASHYRTGEITGPGTLQCESCGELLHFRATGHIPPCPKCHAGSFTRKRTRTKAQG